MQYLCHKLNIGNIKYQGETVNLTKPFEKITMRDSIEKNVGVNFNEIKTIEKARSIATAYNIKFEKYHTIGHIISLFFEEFVEKTIINPTFITEYPIEISPLAAKDEKNPLFTQRSELFIIGREYANMFTELHDPIDQYERFLAQVNEREQGNKEAGEMDMDFVEALEYGMPPTGGCGIGIDRLIMLLTQCNNITDIILFPHLKRKPIK